MENIIKQIRLTAAMSQEQFAKELGRSTVSVNRWENEKSRLTKPDQENLYEFAKKNQIDIAEIMAESLRCETNDKKTILYHGSKKGISGRIEPVSRKECDFGQGFYMETDTLQPLTLVCTEEKPKFYTMTLDLTGLKVQYIDIGMEWALFIAYNRKFLENIKDSEIYI